MSLVCFFFQASVLVVMVLASVWDSAVSEAYSLDLLLDRLLAWVSHVVSNMRQHVPRC